MPEKRRPLLTVEEQHFGRLSIELFHNPERAQQYLFTFELQDGGRIFDKWTLQLEVSQDQEHITPRSK